MSQADEMVRDDAPVLASKTIAGSVSAETVVIARRRCPIPSSLTIQSPSEPRE